MKKRLLILLCLFSLNIITYASFPITESNTETLKTIISEDTEEEDGFPDNLSIWGMLLVGLLMFGIICVLGYGLYVGVKAYLRAWRDDVSGVKLLTYIVLIPLLLIMGLIIIIGYGYGN